MPDTPDAQPVYATPWFTITHAQPDPAKWPAGRYLIVRPDSAMVIPVAEDGRLVLIRGTRDTTGPDPRVELPCGAVEDGESALAAALRELAEETGLVAGRIEQIGEFLESPGISAARCHVFIATALVAGQQKLDPAEDWTPCALTIDEVDQLQRDGTIVDGPTLAALRMFDLHVDRHR